MYWNTVYGQAHHFKRFGWLKCLMSWEFLEDFFPKKSRHKFSPVQTSLIVCFLSSVQVVAILCDQPAWVSDIPRAGI